MVLDKSISLFKEGIEEVILIEFKRLKKPEKIGHFGVFYSGFFMFLSFLRENLMLKGKGKEAVKWKDGILIM